MNWWVCCYRYEPDATSDPVGLVRIWALSDALMSVGDDVTVFAPWYRSALVPRRSRVVAIPMLPGPVIRQISYAVLAFFSGLWLGIRKRPAVVYYRWMESLHPLLLARVFGATCICEVNGEPVPPWGAGGWRGRLTHALASLALRRCDRVVVSTFGEKVNAGLHAAGSAVAQGAYFNPREYTISRLKEEGGRHTPFHNKYRSQLREYFETGDIPTQDQFSRGFGKAHELKGHVTLIK